MMSSFPGFIYSYSANEIYVNLFVGSEVKLKLRENQNVVVKQKTNYPWDGKVLIAVSPETKGEFALKVRIPGWAVNMENPLNLYKSQAKTPVSIHVNGEKVNAIPSEGYVTINRIWKKGDQVELSLPMEPRFVFANDLVKDLKGLVAIASAPIVCCLEECNNPGLGKLKIDTKTPAAMSFVKNY